MTLRRRTLARLESDEGMLDRALSGAVELPPECMHDLKVEVAVLRTLLFGDPIVEGRRSYW